MMFCDYICNNTQRLFFSPYWTKNKYYFKLEGRTFCLMFYKANIDFEKQFKQMNLLMI